MDVFFVISGYLITSILLREYRDGSFSLGRFYQRRIARLFPAFFTVAFATLLASSSIYLSQDFASSGANLSAAALSLANLKYMLLPGGYFTVSPDAQPFLHYWSLSVEEQFYLFFPAVLLLLFSKARTRTTAALLLLCLFSLSTSIFVTRWHPVWAFYLLPTRAWELLTGSVLATFSVRRLGVARPIGRILAVAGISLVFASFFVIKETSAFPGFLATLPVVGTALVVFAGQVGGITDPLLSWGPLAAVGRMSYSLYLWHWPVFSLVDYQFYASSSFFRTALKISLSLLLTILGFLLIERPGRAFLNHPTNRRWAFAFFACAVGTAVCFGIAARNRNYVDAADANVLNGGLAFNPDSKLGSIVLMGDSNASMYGKAAKELAIATGMKLNVISAAAGDPLPYALAPPPRLWTDSLAFIRKSNPDAVILVCNWRAKLAFDKERLRLALQDIQKHTAKIILITQPPELTDSASREGIRNGSRPPFLEDPAKRPARMAANGAIRQLVSPKVAVIDIESLFESQAGTVYFTDEEGRQLFQDSEHLSGFGAEKVKPYLLKALPPPRRF